MAANISSEELDIVGAELRAGPNFENPGYVVSNSDVYDSRVVSGKPNGLVRINGDVLESIQNTRY